MSGWRCLPLMPQKWCKVATITDFSLVIIPEKDHLAVSWAVIGDVWLVCLWLSSRCHFTPWFQLVPDPIPNLGVSHVKVQVGGVVESLGSGVMHHLLHSRLTRGTATLTTMVQGDCRSIFKSFNDIRFGNFDARQHPSGSSGSTHFKPRHETSPRFLWDGWY